MHPNNPNHTQWTGYLDLCGKNWLGRQAISVISGGGQAPSPAIVYKDHLKALRGRLVELYGDPSTTQ